MEEIVLKDCQGCLKVGYCSRECQVSDWSKHKLSCSKSSVSKKVAGKGKGKKK